MKSYARTGIILVLAVGTLGLISGCATNVMQPQGPPQPSKVKLSQYQNIYLEHVAISPEYAKSGVNQNAARKIDEELDKSMSLVFPGLKIVKTEPARSGTGRSLLIQPVIKQIRFIGSAARFWVGPMAGNSAVLMEVKYTDIDTGEVVADPQFYREANAGRGALSIGYTDNMMLEDVARDISSYTAANR